MNPDPTFAPFNPNDVNYRLCLQKVADADVQRLLVKDKQYGASWKKRGGVGAYMNVARKIDRLETQVKAGKLYGSAEGINPEPGPPLGTVAASQYNIFEHIQAQLTKEPENAENMLDTIRDLRGYLLLVEGDLVSRGVVTDIIPETAEEIVEARHDHEAAHAEE